MYLAAVEDYEAPSGAGSGVELDMGEDTKGWGEDTFGLDPNKENKWVCTCQLIDCVACAIRQWYYMRWVYRFANF